MSYDVPMQIMRFFTNPHKPTILALSYPDPKKNVMNLLKAFGECQTLRKLANSVNFPFIFWKHADLPYHMIISLWSSNVFLLLWQTLILGNRDDIEEMSSSSSTVLTMVLKLIDKYDLYGQVAYPKHHKQSEVPEIYRLAAKTKVHSLKKNWLHLILYWLFYDVKSSLFFVRNH